MPPLPEGTLTLLFSDIEGSTSLLKGLGARWGEALSAQRRILRAAWQRHSGHELGTEGDSFFVVFSSAHDALAAAVEGQRDLHAHEWPGGVEVKVRMGIHTGEPERHEEGYIGLDVHRAARIAATASGSQIVVSASTRTLLGRPDADYTLRDLGLHRLKDLPEAEHLYDVVAPDLPYEHPPLRSLGTRASLPSYSTQLIGRDTEVRQLCDAIEGGARLVTLTGPGGTGKTRLAVAVAAELRDRSSCEIFFVALHTADRAALMWSGIADAVGAPTDVDRLPHDRALQYLHSGAAFLVLDNLEQIRDADAVVSELLNGAPQVRVLVTSRRPLHLVEEWQYPVPTLAVPDCVDSPEAGQAGAVDLFVRRAAMVRPGFRLTDDNSADVVALCRRLDGLPLAIELAAARSRLLSPKALLRHLDDTFGDNLAPTNRSERQRTLRTTISWSYDLLDPAARTVFRQLGVFSSRFDLEAAGEITLATPPDASTDGDEADPLEFVAHLVDVSLLEIVEGPDGEPMIWMLETIRRFARDQLRASGEQDAVRLRHAHWCLRMASDVAAMLRGPRQMGALDRMDSVEEDIRAALDWCLADTQEWGDRQETGLSLLQPMTAYWYRFGYVAEGRGWHDRALNMLGRADLADSSRIVDALHGQGIMALQANDISTGSYALEQALEMAARLGDRFREARESNSLGIARREAGEIAKARSLIERSLEIARQIDDKGREATALSNMVHLHMDAGDYAGAVDAARRAIETDQALDDPWGVAIDRCNLVSALLNAEGPREAYEQLVDVAGSAVALGDVELTIDLIDSSAAVWAGLGDAERAAVLLGAADHQRELAGIPRPGPDTRHLARFLDPARRTVAEQAWRRAYDNGRTLSIQDAVAEGTSDKSVTIHLPT